MSYGDTLREGVASFLGTDISQDKLDQYKVVRSSLFFEPNKKYGLAAQNSDASILSVQFGIILSESHTLENTISLHPIEDGSPITDHIQNELRKGSLRCLISNHSIVRGFAPQPPPDKNSWDGIGKLNRPNWKQKNVALQGWNLLEALWEAKQLVTIVTVMKTYSNVAIKSIGTQRDGDTGDALEFTLAFQEVSTVKLGTKEITIRVNPKTSKGKKVAGKVAQGKKATTDAKATTGPGPTAKPVVRQSMMEQAFHRITGA